MKNTLLALCLTLLPLCSMADWQTVKMTTSLPEGTSLTFLVNTSKSGVTMNWGDGTSQSYTDSKDGVIEVCGTVKGANLTLGSDRDITLLSAEGCGLTSIDVSGAPNLQSLYLQNNDLTVLNLGTQANLRDLNVAYNHLTTFSMTTSRFPKLETLDLSHNDLTATSFNYGTENLQHLSLAHNAYENLSLSKNINLKSLCVADNSLTTLDVSKLKAITLLNATRNQLTTVTLPDSAGGLVQIDLSDNAIESPINLSNSRKLTTLNVAHNHLYSLIPSGSARFQTYDISNNALPMSALPRKLSAPSVAASYEPQEAYDLVHIKGMNEGEWISHYWPYAIMSLGYDYRKDEAYIVDMSELRNASTIGSVVFTFYEVAEDGTETPLTLASASNKTGDYTLNSGQVTFQRTLHKAYMTMTDPEYPGLTFRTLPFAVIDPTAEGIGNVALGNAQNSCIYNMQGVEVQQPKAGLYIIRGKKTIVK